MSAIEKLSITGIRSYGADQASIVRFYAPLTLILGKNGCGKTTIIESLKYISTGDVPPGTGKGASFVHDPKMSDCAIVRGQIKLKFHDVNGQAVVTTRIIEATQKAKQLSFKGIDRTMYRDKNGEKQSISSKCADIDTEMITSLGVSKPILNNVIFCHQEESNWPLDEGKKVKEKFDAIFSATKYIKCLDTIKKLRAEMKADVRKMQEILVELKKWKEEATTKRKELSDSNEQKANINDEKEKLKEQIQTVRDRLRHICDLEKKIGTLSASLTGKEHQLTTIREMQKDLREKLTEQIDCSDEELYLKIQDFQREVETKEREQRTVKNRLEKTEESLKENQSEMSRTQREQGELEAAHKRHLSRVSSRNQELSEVAQKYSFREFLGLQDYSETDAEGSLSKLMKVIEEEQNKILKKKQEFEEKERNIQEEIDSLRSQEAALDHEIKSKTRQLEETGRNLRTAKQQLMRNESDLSGADLDTLKSDITAVDGQILKEEAKVDVAQLNTDIDAAKRRKREGDMEMEDIKRIIAKMNRQASARSKYDLLTKEKKELEDKIQFLKRKRADELEHLLGTIPEDNIKNKFDARTQELRNSLTSLSRNLETLNKRKTQLDMRINTERQNQKQKEDEIKDLDNQIDRLCQGSTLDKTLEKSKEMKEDLARERGDLSSMVKVLTRFTERLQQRDCCPLCHRDFPSKDDVNQLIEELEEKVKNMPAKLEQVKNKLEAQEKSHDQLIQLKPQRDRANKARVELDKIRAVIEKNLKELETVDLELETKKELLDMSQGDEEMARLIQSDIITIETNVKKVKQLNEDIEDLQATLGTSDAGMTMEEAMSKQNEVDEKLRESQTTIDNLQEKLQDHKDHLQALKDRKLKLSTKELELKTKLQETEKLKDEISKLEGERTQAKEAIEKAQAEVAPFKYDITSKTRDKTNMTREKESWIDAQNTQVNKIREQHREISSIHSNIKEYIRGGKEALLNQCHSKVTRLKREATEMEERKKSLESQKDTIQEQLANQNQRKRTLEDERKIRDKEVEAKRLQEEIDDLQDRIAGFNYTKLSEEKNSLITKDSRMQQENANMDGRLTEIEGRIKALDMALRTKTFRDADKNYKEKLVTIKCTDTAADDLDKYYKALDTAIMKYHSEKMQTINRIIREFWMNTYQGNDIDYIQIKTDGEGTESQGADKRRIYNYRVVMIKHKVEMDMRGRCSAGQKVLASLIIRMALAETFSRNCGILALDEPTTNLDRDNIKALADALVEIVKQRSHQRNFQLIIITHDATFLNQLGHSEYIENYTLVDRKENGLSYTSQKPVRDL